jgi:predicted enzyme related to lactoylglutathione lyase
MKPTKNIALQTGNADQALDFYQRVLGLEPKSGSKDTVSLGSMNLIVDQANDFHGPVFEFVVDDLEATKEKLLQEGCEIVRWEGQGGCCFMRDPHGLCFNLWQD